MLDTARDEADLDVLLRDWSLTKGDLLEIQRARSQGRLWTALHLCHLRRTGCAGGAARHAGASHKPPAAAWSPNPEERRKAILAYLAEGLAALVWDNIPLGTTISCPTIEKVLTAESYSDRILGQSTNLTVPCLTVMAFTGNNIGPKGDHGIAVPDDAAGGGPARSGEPFLHARRSRRVDAGEQGRNSAGA